MVEPGASHGLRGVIRWTVPGHARVLLDSGEEIDAVLPRRVCPESDPESPVVVGDRAVVMTTPEGPVVERVTGRTTTLARRAAGHKPRRQVLAANAEQLVCVFAAAEPEPRWGMLDRYLIIGESAGIRPVVCITKSELLTDAVRGAIDLYRGLGYRVLTVSARNGEGVDTVRDAVRSRRTVIAGKSGVGKSTLLNALVPGASQVISDVGAQTGKGRHTTTLAVLFPVAGGGWLIDTPGVREIAPWGIAADEASHWFVEMAPLLGGCRFAGSCSHTHETGCAVKAGVESGAVSRMRYESYLRVLGAE